MSRGAKHRTDFRCRPSQSSRLLMLGGDLSLLPELLSHCTIVQVTLLNIDNVGKQIK